MKMISKYFPNDKILSEEQYDDWSIDDRRGLLSVHRLWVVDPMDGTTNFVWGRQNSAAAVAYHESGVAKAAAIYDPFKEQLFWAEDGNGAYEGDTPIRVDEETELTKIGMATDNGYTPEHTRDNLLRMALLNHDIPRAFIGGSAVLQMCEVASGRLGAYYHTCLKPWDNDPFLIVQEAGGIIKSPRGEDVDFMTESVVMGNESVVEQIVDQFKRGEQLFLETRDILDRLS